MRLFLDTSTFIEAYESGIENMPKKTQQLLSNPETDRVIGAISLTEIAIKTTNCTASDLSSRKHIP